MPRQFFSLMIYAAVAATSTVAVAQECVPACRQGFVCMKGSCVTACNPPCAQGETCTAKGECVANQTPAAPAGMSGTDGKSWTASVKGGLLFPGEVYFAEYDAYADTNSGPLLIGQVDALLGPKFSAGAVLLLAFTGIDQGSARITTIGPTLKARFAFDRFELRPGLVLGYQMITPEEGDGSQGFDAGLLVEGVFSPGGTLHGAVELGFITQPAGGNDATDLTFGPIVYVAGGIEFGG